MNLFSEAYRQSQTAPGRPVDPVWLNAIRKVETDGERDPDNAVGDHRLAVGAFQIHPNYYIDATGQDPTKLKADPRRDFQKSVQAVLNYIRRYGKNLTDDERAMLHHYGPNWRKASKRTRALVNVQRGGIVGRLAETDPYVDKYRAKRRGYDTLVESTLAGMDNPLGMMRPAQRPSSAAVQSAPPIPLPPPVEYGNVTMGVQGTPVNAPQARQNADGTLSPGVDKTGYTVKDGDTLWSMWRGRANKAEGWNAYQLRMQKLNPGVNMSKLKPGQTLRTQ